MYQGIVIPYFLLALCIESAIISNRYFGLGSTSILKVPFGPLYPNLVPSPPDIITTANLLFFNTSIPAFSNSLYSSFVSLSGFIDFTGFNSPTSTSTVFLIFSYNLSNSFKFISLTSLIISFFVFLSTLFNILINLV